MCFVCVFGLILVLKFNLEQANHADLVAAYSWGSLLRFSMRAQPLVELARCRALRVALRPMDRPTH